MVTQCSLATETQNEQVEIEWDILSHLSFPVYRCRVDQTAENKQGF